MFSVYVRQNCVPDQIDYRTVAHILTASEQCFSTALSSICSLFMARILEFTVFGPYNEGFSSAGCDETLVSGPQSGGQFQEREETSFIQKIKQKMQIKHNPSQ